jgi:hypothetical protein
MTDIKCYNYIEDESCILESEQKGFYMSTITQPLSYIIIIIFGIILCLIALQILSTLIFYLWFQILMIHNYVIESDEINVRRLKMHEMYYYKLFNYIHCFDDQSSKENEEKHIKNKKMYDFFDFTTSNSCYDKEPYAKITLINNFYNFQLHLMMYAITATLIAAFLSQFMSFLNINGYVIIGKSIISFIKEYIWVLLSFFIIGFFIILNSLIYKYYFADSVVANIFVGYNEMLKLDRYVFNKLEETKQNTTDTVNAFLNLLQQLQKDDFKNESILSVISAPFVKADQSSNKRIADIILNIREETDQNRKAAKIFMYTIYIYFHNQNADNDNILTIINDILTQKNKDNIYTFRSLLPLEIDEKNVIFDLNSIVQLLGTGIFTIKQDQPTSAIDGEAEYIASEKLLEYAKIQGLKETKDFWLGKHKEYYDDALDTTTNKPKGLISRKQSDINDKETGRRSKIAALEAAKRDLITKQEKVTKCEIEIFKSFDKTAYNSAVSSLPNANGDEVKTKLEIISTQLDNLYTETKNKQSTDSTEIDAAKSELKKKSEELDTYDKELQQLKNEKAALENAYTDNVKQNVINALYNWAEAVNKIEKMNIIRPSDTIVNGIITNLGDLGNLGKYIAADGAVLANQEDSALRQPGSTIDDRIKEYKSRKTTLTPKTLTDLQSEKTQATNSAVTAKEIYDHINNPSNIYLTDTLITKLISILPEDITPVPIDRYYEVENSVAKKTELLKLNKSTSITTVITIANINTTYKNLLIELKTYKDSLKTAKEKEFDLQSKELCRDDINEFRTFDFPLLASDSYTTQNLKKFLATRLNEFYSTLMSIRDIKGTLKIDKIGKDLNLVLIFIWIIPSVMLLAVLYMIRSIAKDNENLRRAINFIVELILAAFDEFFWGVVF